MKKETIISYVYDFLSDLIDLVPENSINQIILFGSVSRNDFDEESDIDIFIDTKKDIEKEYKNALFNFEKRSEKTWKLKGIDMPINAIRDNLDNKKWKELREEILSDGIILYGKYKSSPKELENKYLITYSIKDLNTKEKMKIIRILNGYITVKNGKKYKTDGLIRKTNSLRVGTNTIIVSHLNQPYFKKIFKENKVKYIMRKIWG